MDAALVVKFSIIGIFMEIMEIMEILLVEHQ